MPGPESYQAPEESQEIKKETNLNEWKDKDFDEYWKNQKETIWKLKNAEEKDKQIDAYSDKTCSDL